MPATSVAQRRYMAILEHDPARAKASGMTHAQLHAFAATPEKGLPKRKNYAENGSPPDHWIQGVTDSPSFHKGALTAKAHRAGESPMQFARAHKDSGGRLGKQANFALNVNKRRNYAG